MMARYCLVALAALCLLMSAPANALQGGPSSKAEKRVSNVAGDYNLVGVMETASQLLIKPGGEYQWALTVGGLDLYSEGEWKQDGDQIILGPHRYKADQQVFKIVEARAWRGEDAEAAQNATEIRLSFQAERMCRFLIFGATWGIDEPVFPNNLPLQERFEQAVKMESELRQAYNEAISAYLSRDPLNKDDDLEVAARTAKNQWELSVEFLKQSAAEAGKNASFSDPVLPEECKILTRPEKAAEKAAMGEGHVWSKGTGLWFGGMRRPIRYRNIDVVFTFDDGSTERANSLDLGFAFVPVTSKRILTKIDLSMLHKDEQYVQSIDVKNDDNARVITIYIDNRLFLDPPFEQLVLSIKDGTLTPLSLLDRGTYIRSGD